jgi:hypothetical protein
MPFWHSSPRYISLNSTVDEDDPYRHFGLFASIPLIDSRKRLIPKQDRRIHWHMLLIWFLILTIGFVISNLLCSKTVYDECDQSDPILKIRNLMDMLVYSVPIFFIGYVHTDECNKFKRFYYIPTILVSITAFSFISWIPFLHVSIQMNSIEQQWTWPTYVVIIIATLLVLVLIGYHIRTAFKVESRTRFKYGYKYLIYILAFIGFYVGSYVYLIEAFPTVNVHFHHWFIFWFLSMFAQFNTHASIVSQAICVGIYVQGASAYGITDTIFEV